MSQMPLRQESGEGSAPRGGVLTAEHAVGVWPERVEGSPRRRRLLWTRRDSTSNGAAAAFAAELARSRRYGRPLALIGIASPGGTRPSARAAAALRPFVRAIDTVWASDSRIYVLLPESDAGAADVVVERLRAAKSRDLEDAAINVAVFPSDALTAASLLELAAGGTAGATPDRLAPGGVEIPAEAPTGLQALPTGAAAS